jgi:hypothetical protein
MRNCAAGFARGSPKKKAAASSGPKLGASALAEPCRAAKARHFGGTLLGINAGVRLGFVEADRPSAYGHNRTPQPRGVVGPSARALAEGRPPHWIGLIRNAPGAHILHRLG